LIHNHQQVISTEYFLQYEETPFSRIKRRALQGIGIYWLTDLNLKMNSSNLREKAINALGFLTNKSERSI
jgi:hypothetical protein